LIPELQGRFPIRVELSSLTAEDFKRILKEPKNALTRQYVALFDAESVTLQFEDDALDRLAELAGEVNAESENIGARRLQTLLSRLLTPFLYDMPERLQAGSVLLVTRALVEERLSGLVKNKDLSRFIL
jgi:ATP-dependent HslUV protease ATP-binding subunit HslU